MSAEGAAVGELPEALRAWIEEKMGEKEVDMSGCRLGDVGAVFVAEKLRGNTVVKLLWLVRCSFGAVGLRALGESLAEDNVTLRWLGLRGNEVGDDAVESMAQMLRKNTTLEEVRLKHCGVGARGARALGEALKESTTLKYLDLGGNDIGGDGTDALVDALWWSESLKQLHLMQCQLTDDGASSLLSALRESNSTLTHLDLYGNDGIKDQAIKESIQKLVQENKDVLPASAERRARCLLFCCLKLAPKAHEHVVPSIGAVPVPVMRYAVEHAGKLHVAKRFEIDEISARESSAGVRDRSTLPASSLDLQPAAARRR